MYGITNVLDIVKDVKAEHGKHEDDCDETPLDPSWPYRLVNSPPNLGNKPAFGLNNPNSQFLTSSKVGEDTIVDVFGILVQLLLCFFDPFANLYVARILGDLIFQVSREPFEPRAEVGITIKGKKI